MTAPTPNAELAYRVLDHIDAHPEQWSQGVYIGKAECGTIACFAGWTCLLSGDQPRHYFGSPSTDMVVVDDVEAMHAGGRAEELLGASRYLNEGEEDEEDLFDGGNDRETLGRLLAEIFGPRPESCGYTLAHPGHDWTKLANDERPFDQPARCDGLAEDVPPNAGSAS